MAAAEASGAEQLWSLGDMVGGGPDPARRGLDARALPRGARGQPRLRRDGLGRSQRLGEPGTAGTARSSTRASARRAGHRLAARTQARGRRDDVQCWHGSPRNAVWEFVGPANAGACLAVQRAPLGLVAHTHVAAAWRGGPEAARSGSVAPGIRSTSPPASGSSIPAPWAPRSPRGSAGGTAGRAGRRRGVLAAARPGRAHGDLAPRAVRSRPGARPRPRARSGRPLEQERRERAQLPHRRGGLVGEHLHADVVGAGVAVRAHPLGDGRGVAPRRRCRRPRGRSARPARARPRRSRARAGCCGSWGARGSAP